jgi:hypothetical protein
MPDEVETIESLTEALQGVIEVLTEQAWFITNIMHTLEEKGIKIRGVMYDKPPTH